MSRRHMKTHCKRPCSGWLRAGLLLPILLVLGLYAAPISAQDLPSSESFIHTFARPGQPTIQVYIMGSVGTAGIWRIEQDTDLIELLSAANVSGFGENPPDHRTRVNLRIYRTNSDTRAMAYEARLDDVLAEGATYPPLEEGDVLEVETQRRRTLGIALASQVIGAASSLTLLILRLTGSY